MSCSGFDDANPQLTTFRGQYAVRSVEAGVPIGADLLVGTLAKLVTDLVGTLHAGLLFSSASIGTEVLLHRRLHLLRPPM